MKREKIKAFIELLIENHKRQEPFISIIDDMDLYQVIWDTEDALARALGIPEDIVDYTIRDYVSGSGNIYDENDNKINTIDELIDFIIRYMEQ